MRCTAHFSECQLCFVLKCFREEKLLGELARPVCVWPKTKELLFLLQIDCYKVFLFKDVQKKKVLFCPFDSWRKAVTFCFLKTRMFQASPHHCILVWSSNPQKVLVEYVLTKICLLSLQKMLLERLHIFLKQTWQHITNEAWSQTREMNLFTFWDMSAYWHSWQANCLPC